jgi:hypothetical protein
MQPIGWTGQSRALDAREAPLYSGRFTQSSHEVPTPIPLCRMDELIMSAETSPPRQQRPTGGQVKPAGVLDGRAIQQCKVGEPSVWLSRS